MNKRLLRTLIIIIAIIVAIIVGVAVWKEVISYHKLTIIDNDHIAAVYYQKQDGQLLQKKSVSNNETVSVKNGTYCIAATDSMYDATPVCVIMNNKDTSVTLNPDYSTSYLAQLLTPALQSQLLSMITTKYQPIINGYVVGSGQLFGHGEWYGTTLTVKVDPQDRGDTYRTLFEKVGNSWQMIAYPQIVLSKYDYPKVPVAILDDINHIVGVS